MDFDLNEYLNAYISEIIRAHVSELPKEKTRFTARDIAERYGLKCVETAQRMIREGDFGEYIRVGKYKVVTLEGVLAYEAKNTTSYKKRIPQASAHVQRRRANPGRI